MVRVTFHHADGRATEATGPEGQSLMQLAVNAGIKEILAECGGACACGTCHCFIDAAWYPRLPAADANEAAMIECVENPSPNSRLSCQIKLSPALDGLSLRLPESQF